MLSAKRCETRKRKNALFGLLVWWRLRCVLTGAQAEAYATERQKLDGVIVFSYDATPRNDLEPNALGTRFRRRLRDRRVRLRAGAKIGWIVALQRRTGRNACATCGFADLGVVDAGGGAFCSACRGARWGSSRSESDGAAGYAILYCAWRSAWRWAISGSQCAAAVLSWRERGRSSGPLSR